MTYIALLTSAEHIIWPFKDDDVIKNYLDLAFLLKPEGVGF